MPNLGDFYLMLCNNLMLSNISSDDVICFIEISVTYAKMESDILLKITHERKLNSPCHRSSLVIVRDAERL